MSWLSSFLHPEKAYDKAQQEREKYYNQGQGYLNPYNQNGIDTYGKYSGAMDKLLNPAALQDEWNKGYKESDFAKQNEAMASQSGLNAAQQMGLGGSAPALQAIQSGTAGIVAKDRQQYLDDLMQKYMAGIGIGQDIYGKGAGAAGQMSQNANQMGQDSAQLTFNKNNAQGDMFGKLLGYGAGAIGSALGGPIGGALGAGLSQSMGWSPKGSYNPAPYYTGGK
jgi:hypothetical protein